VGGKMKLNLKFRIIELFGNQANFAQKMEVQESLVSRVVRGRRSISKEDQKKWARILRQNVKHLFEG
jgi:plasmid maintenance system antidote protein VapI